MRVISCGLRHGAPQTRCARSVTDQTLKVQHDLLMGPAPVCEKLIAAWRDLPDDEIVVWLDSDDYLAHDEALRMVRHYHEAGAWVTFGQFIWKDGSVGFAGPADFDKRGSLRGRPWRTTLLRTFRAGLAKRIRDEDMRQLDGQYSGWVPDQRVMLAVCEMAGPRAVFVPQVLAVYTGTVDGSQREMEETRHIHRMQPYERIASL